MNILELFAGSRSIGKVADKLGMNVFSVDWEKYENINLSIDISEIKKEDVPPKYINMFEFYFGVKDDYYQIYFDNMRFMNHSNEPNCIDLKNGLCVAIKDIEIDEISLGQKVVCQIAKQSLSYTF